MGSADGGIYSPAGTIEDKAETLVKYTPDQILFHSSALSKANLINSAAFFVPVF